LGLAARERAADARASAQGVARQVRGVVPAIAQEEEDSDEEEKEEEEEEEEKEAAEAEEGTEAASELFRELLRLIAEEAKSMLPALEKSAVKVVSEAVQTLSLQLKDVELGLLSDFAAVAGCLEKHLETVLIEEGIAKLVSKFLLGRCGEHLPAVRALHQPFISHALLIGASLEELSKLGSEPVKLAEQMEMVIADKLKALGSASKKAFSLLGGKGSIKSRVVKSVLSAATKYEVSAGGFQGSFDMLRLALRRSPIQARTPILCIHPAPPLITLGCLRSAAQRRRQRADVPARQAREARGACQERL